MAIQFQLNEPQILKLADPNGDLSGSHVFYPTCDSRVLCLPESAARQLADLSLQPGEEVSIARYSGKVEPKLPLSEEWESWVICLTPRSEKARADAEIAAQELRARQLARETRENPGRQLADSIAQLRQMPKSGDSAAQDRPGAGRGLDSGPYVPTNAPAPRKRGNGQISYSAALRQITDVVLSVLLVKGEQWTDQAKQDLISTAFISAAKSGVIVFDFAGGEQ